MIFIALFAVPIATAAPGASATKKVLVFGVDGLRSDALFAADTPHIDKLIANGCWMDRASTGEITVSGPGWSSFLCGVWMDKHGSRGNKFRNVRYDQYPHFFARLKEARPDLRTAHIVDWLPIDRKILGAFEPDVRFAVDYKKDGDARCTAKAVEVLATQDADVTFVYFADVDEIGHEHGFHPTVPAYIRQIEEVDAQIGRILAAQRSRPNLAAEDWLILLSTDHGGTIDGEHGRDEPAHREIIFIASGRAAARGQLHQTINIVDIPATVLAHLGVPIEPEWGWDGRPVGFPVETRYGTNLIFNGDAEYSTGYADAARNAGIAGWTDWGCMTVVSYGSPEFPQIKTHGPSRFGRQFFCGGATYDGKITRSEISQLIDISDRADHIDSNLLRFELSGALGGYRDQRDLAWVEARFLDHRGGAISKARIGPVTLEDRQHPGDGEKLFRTALLERTISGDLPPQTRRVEIRLVAEAAKGDNDGYADNLSFVLRRR